MIRPKGTPVTPEVIGACIAEHQRGVPRLQRLLDYYTSKQDILGKVSQNPLAPNNKIVAPNPYYIVTVANGYTFANPITYKSAADITNLLQENKLAKVESHDAELGEDLSIYGVGYELVHMSSLPRQHVKLNNFSPLHTFVVFTDEADPEPLFACYYYTRVGQKGEPAGIEVNVYDGQYLTVLEGKRLGGELRQKGEPVPHYAGQVPIVEYKNNDEGLGDFERVMTLIDAYDRLQSDRIDDKDQFIDAILAVYGASISGDGGELPKAIQNLRVYKIIEDLPPESRIEYLKKALDEAGVEVLRNALRSDISKFSLVPELTDESFAGNISGVAMEYKTLGLQWLGNIKRRMFKKGLARRLQIMNNYMTILGRGFDWTDVDVVFSKALPVDRASLLPYAERSLSQKSMVSYLSDPFGITDVQSELEQKATEEGESAARAAAAYSGNIPFGELDGDSG